MLARVFRFGEFKLDMERYQLERDGRAVRLESLPLQLLMLLVTRRGQLVSRREIEEELWGRDVYVAAEQGINTAIRKVRMALREDPERPRYLQTVVGRGYRFLAADVMEEDGSDAAASIPRKGDAAMTVSLEELGQAILTAAGLEASVPNLKHIARSS